MAVKYDHVLGTLCIVIGLVIIMFILGELLIRILISLFALVLINYGLRLRGLPPLQLLLPLLANKKYWFKQQRKW